MPKQPTGVGLAEKRALKLAEQMNYKLVDVELVKEATGRFLRFFIDKPDGVTLDDCEAFHRQVNKLMDDIDYDYMEVSSPGVDRPLKRQADFDEAMGEKVEVRLYRPINGQKVFTGLLMARTDKNLTIEGAQGEEITFDTKLVALVKIVFELDESLLEVLDEDALSVFDEAELGEDGQDEPDEAISADEEEPLHEPVD
ncbi:MAG: ribosome maturation factor RimP [Clostridia bacterium]